MIHISCSFIENGLVFSPDGLFFCCLPIHGLSGWPFIAPFSGGALPIDIIYAKREELRSKINAGSITSCYGCDYYLQWQEAKPERAYLFNTLVDNHHTLCNLRCDYCCWGKTHVAEYGQNAYAFLPVLQALLKEGHMDPNGLIAWGGGEPALLPEFKDCMLYARSFSGLKNDIYSNATIYSKEIYEALKNPNNSLQCSVDAGTPETYIAMKKQDHLKQVWENLEAYGATGGRLMIKYLVTAANNNVKDFEAFIEQAARRNLLQYLFMVDMSFEHPVVSEEIVQGMARLANMLEDAGASVIAGVHGNHTLPRQMVRSRVLQWKELLRLSSNQTTIAKD